MNQAVLNAKQEMVAEITNKIKEAGATVVVEYRGLTVAEVTELRRALKAENVDLKVYKNTMFERAADDLGYSDIKPSLKGPNAYAFSADATAGARVLAKFAKKHKALILKEGIVEGRVCDDKMIKELSTLPNKEGMLSMLLGCLQQPLSGFAPAVQAVADARAEGGAAPAAPAAEEAKEEAAAA